MNHPSRYMSKPRRDCRARKSVESLGLGMDAVGCDLFEDHLGAHIGIAGRFGIYWVTGGESWFTDESGREHALVAAPRRIEAPPVDPEEDLRREQDAARNDVERPRRQERKNVAPNPNPAPASRPAPDRNIIY